MVCVLETTMENSWDQRKNPAELILHMVIFVLVTPLSNGFRAIIYMPNVVSAVALATMWLQYVFSPKFGLFKTIGELLHWFW